MANPDRVIRLLTGDEIGTSQPLPTGVTQAEVDLDRKTFAFTLVQADPQVGMSQLTLEVPSGKATPDTVNVLDPYVSSTDLIPLSQASDAVVSTAEHFLDSAFRSARRIPFAGNEDDIAITQTVPTASGPIKESYTLSEFALTRGSLARAATILNHVRLNTERGPLEPSRDAIRNTIINTWRGRRRSP